MPFWRGVLGYDPTVGTVPINTSSIHTGGWRRSGSKRWASCGPMVPGPIHLVVWVPWDQAESRVAARVAACGRVVRQSGEELAWSLVDPVGNEVDIAAMSASPGEKNRAPTTPGSGICGKAKVCLTCGTVPVGSSVRVRRPAQFRAGVPGSPQPRHSPDRATSGQVLPGLSGLGSLAGRMFWLMWKMLSGS